MNSVYRGSECVEFSDPSTNHGSPDVILTSLLTNHAPPLARQLYLRRNSRLFMANSAQRDSQRFFSAVLSRTCLPLEQVITMLFCVKFSLILCVVCPLIFSFFFFSLPKRSNSRVSLLKRRFLIAYPAILIYELNFWQPKTTYIRVS